MHVLAIIRRVQYSSVDVSSGDERARYSSVSVAEKR